MREPIRLPRQPIETATLSAGAGSATENRRMPEHLHRKMLLCSAEPGLAMGFPGYTPKPRN
jgi:hypothetical protein